MLTDPSLIYLSTIIPPILLGLAIWKSDKFPEPGKFLVASFLLGVSISFPLHLFIMIAEDHIAPLLGLDLNAITAWNEGAWKDDNAVYPAAERTFMSFFRAAFLEEGIKFAILLFFCVRLSALNEPMDAIVYGAAIGLGYAAMENLGYLNSGDLETAWTFSIVKVRYLPLVMHLGFGVLMGWLLSLNLFEERSQFKRRIMLILALAVPVTLHGSYNYLRAYEVFPVLTLILTIGIIYFYRREQLRKITEDIDKAKIENIDVFYSYLVSVILVTLVILSAIIT
ncbi:PrsW family intramembrane metalloprotease [Pelagibacterales bacterium SAG-MED29]|nr:PrsW family intramembrane metalloprotease [Pelagibacterales bacterium SAG-MED29]